MDPEEESPPYIPPPPEPPPPLQYAGVMDDGGALYVEIEHPAYNGGGAVRVTGYRDADGALEGAYLWDALLRSGTPPAELVSVSGERFERSEA